MDGKLALQFQITDNFQLTDFQGIIFSGKYQLGKRDAIRLGNSLDFDDQESNAESSGIDTLSLETATIEEDRFRIRVNSQYIEYLTLIDNLALSGGTGPFLNFETQILKG